MWTTAQFIIWHWMRFFTYQRVDTITRLLSFLVVVVAVLGGVSIVVLTTVNGTKQITADSLLWTFAAMLVVVFVMMAVYTLGIVGEKYSSWVGVHRRMLVNEAPYFYPEMETLNSPWVLLPVPYDRKVLLMKARIPVQQALSRRVRRLSDEDLRVMEVLHDDYVY